MVLTMSVELFDDKILLIPDKEEKVTKGGIYIPDSVGQFDSKKTGTVVAHGPGLTDQSTGELFSISVYEGCRVSFPAFLGQEFSGKQIGMPEETYLLLTEKEIDFIIGNSIDWIDNRPFEEVYSNFGLVLVNETYAMEVNKSQTIMHKPL